MNRNLKDESGMTLVESMMAILILLVGLLAMAQVLAFSVVASKNYGRDAGKTTVSARNKMEELTGLQFTTSGTAAGLTAGGSIYPSSPVTGYVEYINQAGSAITTTSPDVTYVRQWQISDTNANTKQIMVSVSVNNSKRRLKYGETPSTTMVTVKTKAP